MDTPCSCSSLFWFSWHSRALRFLSISELSRCPWHYRISSTSTFSRPKWQKWLGGHRYGRRWHICSVTSASIPLSTTYPYVGSLHDDNGVTSAEPSVSIPYQQIDHHAENRGQRRHSRTSGADRTARLDRAEPAVNGQCGILVVHRLGELGHFGTTSVSQRVSLAHRWHTKSKKRLCSPPSAFPNLLILLRFCGATHRT